MNELLIENLIILNKKSSHLDNPKTTFKFYRVLITMMKLFDTP